MSTPANSEDPARAAARRQVRAIRGFYIHATVYVAVIVMLGLINISTGDAWHGNWWVQWPAMGWGVALLIHGIFALNGSTLFGRDWEERKIDELMKRQNRNG